MGVRINIHMYQKDNPTYFALPLRCYFSGIITMRQTIFHILQILTPIVFKIKISYTRLLYLRSKTWYISPVRFAFSCMSYVCSTLNYTPLDDNEQKTQT